MEEILKLVALVDLSSPEKLKAFADWKTNDGSKEGLLKLETKNEKKLIRQKGYTLEVVSWENDGDHYNTELYHTESKDKALAIKKMCDTLLQSRNGAKSFGISNGCDLSESEEKRIITFVKDNLDLVYGEEDEEYLEECGEMDFFSELCGEIVGVNECGGFRVSQKCDIQYSKEDLYIEIIE